jgi:hypothetical protein
MYYFFVLLTDVIDQAFAERFGWGEDSCVARKARVATYTPRIDRHGGPGGADAGIA